MRFAVAQESNISSMEDIQNLFKETKAEFMENGLDAELVPPIVSVTGHFLTLIKVKYSRTLGLTGKIYTDIMMYF